MIKKCPNCNSSKLTIRMNEIICKKCGYIHKKGKNKVLVSKNWEEMENKK